MQELKVSCAEGFTEHVTINENGVTPQIEAAECHASLQSYKNMYLK